MHTNVILSHLLKYVNIFYKLGIYRNIKFKMRKINVDKSTKICYYIVIRINKGGKKLEHDRLEAFMTLLKGASVSITKIKSRGMSCYGLGSTHTACMRRLYDAPDGATRTQLAEACELDKAQITRIVSELSEKGYVTEKSGASNYKRRIVLTERGRSVTGEINSIVLSVNQFVSQNISDDDIATFYRIFGEICTRLKLAEELEALSEKRKD